MRRKPHVSLGVFVWLTTATTAPSGVFAETEPLVVVGVGCSEPGANGNQCFANFAQEIGPAACRKAGVRWDGSAPNGAALLGIFMSAQLANKKVVVGASACSQVYPGYPVAGYVRLI